MRSLNDSTQARSFWDFSKWRKYSIIQWGLCYHRCQWQKLAFTALYRIYRLFNSHVPYVG